MVKNSLVSSKHDVPETSTKRQRLSNLIDTFIFSNLLNVFKVIYIKKCKSKKYWHKQIATHVGGIYGTKYLTYEVEVLTYMYSNSKHSYVQKRYVLDKIPGFEIVDSCFQKISDVSKCDVLVINIKALDENIFTPTNYRCSYLFARM